MIKTPLHISIAATLTAAATLQAQQPTPSRRISEPVTETELGRSSSLPEVVVTDTAPQTPYGPPPKTYITGLPSPIRELPITVNTVTEQFIKDVSARRIRDLVGYVPGVNASEDSGGTGDLLNIRGFEFIYQSYVNGMRNRLGLQASREFSNFERVEIFKGPGGVEFGAGDPGGFVNYVTKKPQTKQSLTLGMEVGSYEYIGGYLDATGPLWTRDQLPSPTGKDGKTVAAAQPDDLGLFYRLIVSGNSANSFRDTFDTDRVLAAPSILWKYAEDSSVLLEFQYGHHDQPYDRGMIYLEGADFSGNFTPINLSYHEPDDFLESNDTRTSLYWTHKLNDTISLRLTGEVNTTDLLGRAVRSPFTFLLYDGTNRWNGDRVVQRTTQFFDSNYASYGIKPEVLLNFDTGSAKHAGLLGFNYLLSTYRTKSQDGFDSRPIDFKNPVYGLDPIKLPPADPTDPNSIPSGARDFRSAQELEEYGVYYQHKIDLFERVHLLGGVRYEWYESDFAFTRNVRAFPLSPVEGFSDQNFSWRVGGVFDVLKNVSLFAGYSNSFQPQEGILSGGGSADALEATAFEAGIKASFFDNRLQTTLSVYETERENLLESDPNDPTFTFVIPLGTVKVRGIEFEVTGQLTEDLDIYGGFALMESEITDTLVLTTKGNEFYNVPNVQVGARLRYDTSRWLIKGLSVGVGAIYVGDRAGDALNSFTLPDYWRFDAGLYYTWRNWNFKLTCENVGNERYFLASQGFPDIIQPGAPRLYTFGAEVTF
jgi:iron complex outermembrane receptor protein